MGRSSLQGTPWHYEYLQSQSKSKRCAFNVGYCSNAASLYHGKKCVGKAECEEFERGSREYIDDYNKKREERRLKAKEKAKAKEKTKAKEKSESLRKLNSQKEDNKKNNISGLKKEDDHKEIKQRGGVKVGDSITVEDIETHETTDLNISDSKNPFVGTALCKTVEIQGITYKVTRINDKNAEQQ